ncbi:MAG: hypothetical protein DWI24_06825 [Planctomycetota bacterium]|nr:MAG: hypothetical protein DWI24_06825 [Planctomycetota bacterium]
MVLILPCGKLPLRCKQLEWIGSWVCIGSFWSFSSAINPQDCNILLIQPDPDTRKLKNVDMPVICI